MGRGENGDNSFGLNEAANTALDRLVALAKSLDLEEIDLDDHVYDVFDHEAAENWNAGEGGNDPGDLHDLYSLDASEINNRGLAAQIRCLLTFHGAEATERLLRETASELD